MFTKLLAMKSIYLIMLSAFISTAHAQDFCKQIKKDVSEDKTVFDYASPFEPGDPPPVRVSRSYSISGENKFDNFLITFQIPCDMDSIYNKSASGTQTERDEHGLIVEFEDHSKVTDDAIKISHDFTQDRSQALRVVYYTLTEKAVRDFTTKKIIKFSVAGYPLLLPDADANALMHYIACINAVK